MVIGTVSFVIKDRGLSGVENTDEADFRFCGQIMDNVVRFLVARICDFLADLRG